MIRLFILSLFAVLIFPTSSVQAVNLIDEIAKSCVYLTGCSSQSCYSGTGFLVERNGNVYLVTAAHIAKEMAGERSKVHWNTAGGKMTSFSFKHLSNGVPNSHWFIHPKADIAVHPFGFPSQSAHINIPEDMMMKIDEYLPLLTKVFIVGFPLSLGTLDRLSPIAKRTDISSWRTKIRHPGVDSEVEHIILGDGLAQGYSGAPVFVSPEPQMDGQKVMFIVEPKLVGIQSSTFTDSTGGKLSLLIPVSYLYEIYESEEFRRWERYIQDLGN